MNSQCTGQVCFLLRTAGLLVGAKWTVQTARRSTTEHAKLNSPRAARRDALNCWSDGYDRGENTDS